MTQRKTLEPIIKTFRDHYGFFVTARLDEFGITIRGEYNAEKSSGEALPRFSWTAQQVRLRPCDVESVLKGFSNCSSELLYTYNDGYKRYASLPLSFHFRDKGLFIFVLGEARPFADFLEISHWWDHIGFPSPEMHREVYNQLIEYRAAHLISPPPQDQPVPEVVIPEIIEPEYIDAEFEMPLEAPPSEDSSTSIVVVEHIIEKPQGSVTGLGLRRMAKSAANFARDVAVDVVSRTISRVMTGQQ